MWHSIKIYLILIPLFLFMDYLWLGKIMGGFYKQELGLMARRAGEDLDPLIWAASIVYLLIPLGIILFALPHVSQANLPVSSLFWGFIYGVVLYGIYDMTNLAMLAGWSLKLSMIDMLWGGMICAVSTSLAAYLDRWLA
jgi:uncharacterized membrane protein